MGFPNVPLFLRILLPKLVILFKSFSNVKKRYYVEFTAEMLGTFKGLSTGTFCSKYYLRIIS